MCWWLHPTFENIRRNKIRYVEHGMWSLLLVLENKIEINLSV